MLSPFLKSGIYSTPAHNNNQNRVNTTMTNDEMMILIRKHFPPCITLLNGDLKEIDQQAGRVCMNFELDDRFCHSGVVVQGGYVTAMLDACMAHAASTHSGLTKAASTLELKVSFLRTSNPGKFEGTGQVVKMGRSVAFAEATLINETGQQVARASSTMKLTDSRKN